MDIKELLDNSKKLINDFFDKIETKQIDEIVNIILNSKGLIFFSGVGKSGMVAQKIAVTLTSTGTRAFFISPTDSLHGDMGHVSDGDIIFLLSKSGESDELIAMMPYLRNKGAFIVAVVMNKHSRLAKAAHHVIELPFSKELCPHNMAPTISTTQQLILGDAIAIALMNKKAFSKDQFAANHPAGKLGKQLTMKVEDLMLKGGHVPLCGLEDKLIDILVDFSDKRAGCMVVVDKAQKLKGIFTDGDLRRALQKYGSEVLNLKMKDLMIQNPKKVESQALAYDAMRYMEGDQKSPIMVLPVVEQGDRVVGLLKLHDIIQSGV